MYCKGVDLFNLYDEPEPFQKTLIVVLFAMVHMLYDSCHNYYLTMLAVL